jgi:hypothetical protein
VVQAILGHSDLQTTLGYTHVLPGAQREAVGGWSAICSQLFPSCTILVGVNPSVETNSLGTLAVFIQPSFYLLAGDGVWGRGRRLSPLPRFAL